MVAMGIQVMGMVVDIMVEDIMVGVVTIVPLTTDLIDQRQDLITDLLPDHQEV